MTEPMILEVEQWSRFEIHVDGVRVGLLDYRLSDRVLTIVHTEIDDEFGGRGLGGALVREVLDRVRKRGWAVRPACPFAAAWIGKHPEYADLVA